MVQTKINCEECNCEDYCSISGPICEGIQIENELLELNEIKGTEFPEKDKRRAITRKKKFYCSKGKTTAKPKTFSSYECKKGKKADRVNFLSLRSQVKEYLM